MRDWPETRGEVTLLLERMGEGDDAALGELLPLVYEELRELAAEFLRDEQRSEPLDSSALVHEAYGRLTNPEMSYQNRAEFFGSASQAMRRILVEHASRQASSGDPSASAGAGDDASASQASLGVEVLQLDEALEWLEQLDARKAKVVELRWFGGLTSEQVAEALGVSVTTVDQDWAVARLMLERWRERR